MENFLRDIGYVIAIICIIYSMYTRIKYLCLKKASSMIASVEQLNGLTGHEKFALVVTWIDDELPKIFGSSLFISIIEKLVQYAYDNSKEYATNYIKRKTGYDISEILENLSDTEQRSSTDTKSDDSTNS